VRYAFQYARRNRRKKVSCITKDNIMKMTDGLFHQTFDRIGQEYPELEKEHWIVDIGAAKLADTPEVFDVIVMPNLYGDILSDVAAQIAGSVGMAGSANIGEHVAMFEAIHGSAPPLAGKDVANPAGLLLGAVMMLVHIGQSEVAARVHNAYLRTLEEGIHTQDIFADGVSARKVGTKDFADAVIARLGMRPEKLKPVDYAAAAALPQTAWVQGARSEKALVGVDVFLDWRHGSAEELGTAVQALGNADLKLTMVTNRGVKVWPGGAPETFCTDHWRCRFLSAPEGGVATHGQIIQLLQRFHDAGFDFIKTEHLCTFDGKPGYSLGQGQ
jgi:isocitrate dehydrogenase